MAVSTDIFCPFSFGGALIPLAVSMRNQMATNSMADATYLNRAGSSFTLITCPASMGRSFRLSFRTLQHTRHPHPVLSKSTSGRSPAARLSVSGPANRVRNATASDSLGVNIAACPRYGKTGPIVSFFFAVEVALPISFEECR